MFGMTDLREHTDRWLKQRTFGFCKCHGISGLAEKVLVLNNYFVPCNYLHIRPVCDSCLWSMRVKIIASERITGCFMKAIM
jgi:hypothetical protein